MSSLRSLAPTALAEPPRDADAIYIAHDLIDDTEYQWRGEWNYVRLDPCVRQGHIFRLTRQA